MTHVIHVIADQTGWSVEVDGRKEALWFHRGGRAEAAARALAQAFALAGQDAEIQVFLRNGALGGRLVWSAGAAELSHDGRRQLA